MLGDRRKSVAATVIVCKDGRLRAFTDHGVCLGVVTAENDLETDPDGDPVGFFRGFINGMILICCIGNLLVLGVLAFHWFKG